jgi:hypothetical protein
LNFFEAFGLSCSSGGVVFLYTRLDGGGGREDIRMYWEGRKEERKEGKEWRTLECIGRE